MIDAVVTHVFCSNLSVFVVDFEYNRQYIGDKAHNLKSKYVVFHPCSFSKWCDLLWLRVLFENRPALYFCNYIFITAYIF